MLTIDIQAPPSKIWRLISDIDRWPTWQSSIGAAHIDGSLQPRSRFTWTTGGTEISSVLEVVDTDREIVWTGSAMGLTAIHVWRLVPISVNSTRVEMAESMSGFPSSLFYSSKDLIETDKSWLNELKDAAEHRP